MAAKAGKASAVLHKIAAFFGFQKNYNFVLFFLATGYLAAFALARLQFWSFHGIFCNPNSANGAAPGECYYWLKDPYKTAMQIHLYCILPAALLACFQFVPRIRHTYTILHRVNGYLIIALSLVSSAGALILAKHAFGGDFATQTFVGMLVILTTGGYIMAWINIRFSQIDQHRMWMIRTWSWFATIITLRLIMAISAQIISIGSSWKVTRSCAQVAWTLGSNATDQLYPACAGVTKDTIPDAYTIIVADTTSTNLMEVSAALAVPFGAAGWIAIVLHTIVIEIYIRLTPVETDRLRRLSYERQLKRGFKRPGYAGLVAERLGDAAPYVPPAENGYEAVGAVDNDAGASDDLPK